MAIFYWCARGPTPARSALRRSPPRSPRAVLLFTARGASPPRAPPCGARRLALLGRSFYLLRAGPRPRALRPAALAASLSSGGPSIYCARGLAPARSALRRSPPRSPRAVLLFTAHGASPPRAPPCGARRLALLE